MVMPCESGVASHGVHMESSGFKHGGGSQERNPFRILWMLLLIAGFKLTGMLINENMNTNHVNITRNVLIKLSESCQRLVNHTNTTIPVPVMSVIAE